MLGGDSFRLCPLSSPDKPKQFISLLDEQTPFENTLSRLTEISHLSATYIVCEELHRALVDKSRQSLGVKDAKIILEPVSRNTALAITIAAIEVVKKYPSELLLVLPVDHEIQPLSAFQKALQQALESAKGGGLVT